MHGGGGHGRTSFSDPYGPSIYGDIVNTPVFLAGGQIGYNWQTNGWVFGAELDASHAVSDGTNSCLAFSGNVVIATCKAGPNVFVSGTARVGYAFGPQGRTLATSRQGWPGKTIAARSPTTTNSGMKALPAFRGTSRNSITAVSVGPSEPALSKRSRLLGP